MGMKKKYIILSIGIIALVTAILVTVGVFFLKRSSIDNSSVNENQTPNPITIVTSQPTENISEDRVVNENFKYSYKLPEGYLNSEIHFEDPDDTLGMEHSELVYKDQPRKVNYQVAGINIDVYKLSKLTDDNLKDWIQNQSEEEFSGQKLYITSSINSVRGEEIYFLVSTNPLLGGFKMPFLFIKSSEHIYVIGQVFQEDSFSTFKKLVSTLNIGMENIKLSDEEVNLIK